SAYAATDLVNEVGVHAYARRTGVVPVASFTATKLRWVADNEPENAAKIRAVALPHDWLTWRLRGYGPADESPLGPNFDELVTDRSDASGTAYFNSITNSYDLELLGLALKRDDVENIELPRVAAPDEAIAGSPYIFGPGAGDNAAACLGLGLDHGDVAVSIGTSGTAFTRALDPVIDPSGTVAGFADASGGYLPIITTMNAARVIDATAELLGLDHAGLSDLALSAKPGADQLVLQPWFEGERTPNLPHATATLFNMSLTSYTRPNMARAAYEGVLCSLAYGVDALIEHAGPAQRIFLIGGGAQSPAMQHIAAEVFNIPVVVPQPGEYVARGAGMQAALALNGQLPPWELATQRTLEPRHNPSIRDAYNALLPLRKRHLRGFPSIA
ncbi:MAG TPA: FGGY-family carbohydrate kinase, partial [Beutenbergiaceae bacterium]|nr:FGGY-family carbohydrate kinase [Beutenbergiaceae bacterium]